MAYSAFMSRHPVDPRGAHDFSSPQIRVRGANDFRHYSSQRLRLPNERPPLGPRLRRLFGAVLTLAVLGGIGVAVYFGVTLLLDEDETSTAEVAESAQTVQAEATAQTATESEATESTDTTTAEASQAETQAVAEATEEPEDSTAPSAQAEQSESVEDEAQPAQVEAEVVAVSSIEPSVADQQVTPAQINGAEIIADRVTAEPIPSGIPRTLADGIAYDPTEPATVFTSRWPVGTTLRLTRLTRLPGATLLTDEEQAEVLGTEALVVVRGSESSNTDLQLSPAAFDQIAFYGTERIIAVRVEVTAPPP